MSSVFVLVHKTRGAAGHDTTAHVREPAPEHISLVTEGDPEPAFGTRKAAEEYINDVYGDRTWRMPTILELRVVYS